MKNVTLIRIGITAAAALALAACGDSDGTNPYEQGDSTETTAQPSPAKESASGETIELMDHAGRWSTDRGAVGEGSRLVIDLTSEGVVSIDVRTVENGSEAIMESATGKAAVQGSVIKGTVDQGPGVHGILKKYSTWTLDPQGRLSGGQGTEPVKISKGNQ